MHISTFNFTYQTSNMQQLHGIHQFQHRTQEHNTHILKSWNYHHNIKDFQISIYRDHNNIQEHKFNIISSQDS